METIMHKIQRLHNDMGPGERKIADYILENTQEILSVSISELAARCGCGDATAVRFSRRLGFDGFQSLKIGLAQEFSSASTISGEINRQDSCFDIFQKRITDISTALHNTEGVLDPESLENAAKLIMNADRIAIFGLGNSAAIAQDAAHKFLRLGLDAQACCDNHMQAIIASHLTRDSVAIGISHSGTSKDIIEALQLSKIGRATTICITNHASSPLVDTADITLFTKAAETKHSILAMSSRIVQLAIFDAIYSYIVVNADKASIRAIYNTEAALQGKKQPSKKEEF
ncbi:MAG: MurR/RpiR family transcriptional regulator [Ruminococcaceae bacterium]|nr:MurR/RpiR family transcriptional regulator [Oscillospiraceae bacterium]